MQEEWRDIKGFEGLYVVSNTGKVKALERLVMNNGGLQHKHERILKPHIDRGYKSVVLCKDGKTYPRAVHRLVAIAFIPNLDNKPNVDHIDTNPSNNNVENLKWVTQKENALNPLTRQHLSSSKKGHKYWGRPLTDEERKKISDANKGRQFTDEHRRALSESHKGKSLSKETIQKIADKNKGKKRSEESKQKMREKALGRFKGKKWKIEGGKRVWYSADSN